MDLKQHFQMELVGLVRQFPAEGGGERRGNQEYGIRLRQSCLEQLVTADDEVLPENGKMCGLACHVEVLQRSAEKLLVREYGEGGRAGLSVTGDHFRGIRFFPDPSF